MNEYKIVTLRDRKDLACAEENSAVLRFWGIFSRCLSKWQKSKACLLILPRFPAYADGLCAV